MKDLRIAKLITGEIIIGEFDEMMQTYKKCFKIMYHPHPTQKGMIYPVLTTMVPENLLEGNFNNKILIDIPKEKTIFDIVLKNIKKGVCESFTGMYSQISSDIVTPTKKNVIDISGNQGGTKKS